MGQRGFLPFVVLAVMVVGGAYCAAQSDAGSLAGVVSDPSGLVVPDAGVTATRLETNTSTSIRTNSSGVFAFVALQPGHYRIQVQASGFKGIVLKDVEIHVQDKLQRNFSLEIGTVSEMVNVEGGIEPINTQDASVGTVVDRQFMANMPLNGRSFQSLISLTPGVVITATSAGSQGQFSINGQRPDANYFMIDGVSANVGISSSGAQSALGGGAGVQVNTFGGYNNLASVDAIQEFKIETSTFAPEYGRMPGGQISIVTRTGSNAWHGSLYEYLRNTVLDANNWFNNHNGIARPPERQNDFGGVLGGPVLKNRLFFFFSHESLRLAVPKTLTESVPSLCARGLGSCLPGGVPAVAAMRPLLSSYPLPTVPQAPGTPNFDVNVATFNGAYSDTNNLDTDSLRLDWNASSRMSFFLRANNGPSDGTIRAAGASAVSVLHNGTRTFTVGQTFLFSPRMTNDIRYNYSFVPAYSTQHQDTFGGAVPVDFGNLIPSPYDLTNSFFNTSLRTIGGGLTGTPGLDRNRQYNLIDTVSLVHGKHQLKFGADYRRLHPVSVRAPYTQTLAFTLTTQSWITGNPNVYSVGGFQLKDFTYDNLGLYAQDTWHFTPRVSINYGLRWDYNPPPNFGADGALLALTGINPNDLSATHVAQLGTPLFETQMDAFAPRVGVAYQLSTSNEWGRVIRAGWGLFFDTAGAAAGFLERPLATKNAAAPIPFPIPAALQTPVAFPTAPPWGSISAVSPDLRLPYTHQTNLALEQMLGAKQVLTLTYAGAWARNLMRRDQFTSPNPDIPLSYLAVESVASSSYNSLQTLFQRRLSAGLQGMVSYTWSHSEDNSSQNFQNSLNPYVDPLSQYWGNSEWDIRHSLQGAVSYSIPAPAANRLVKAFLGNWGVDSLYRARTAPPIDLVQSNAFLAAGRPFTGTCSPTPCVPAPLGNNTAGTRVGIRPSLVPGASVLLRDASAPGGWRLDPTAFRLLPANSIAATQGTLGRNQLRNFAFNQLDFTVRRSFPIHEALTLQFRTDFFNLFNHPNFYLGGSALDVTSPLFGRAAATLNNSLGAGGAQGGYSPIYQAGGPRSVQFSLKLVF